MVTMMAAPVMSTVMMAVMAVPDVMASFVMLLMLSRGGKRGCYDECCRKS
jgi:hypothetical protein